MSQELLYAVLGELFKLAGYEDGTILQRISGMQKAIRVDGSCISLQSQYATVGVGREGLEPPTK